MSNLFQLPHAPPPPSLRIKTLGERTEPLHIRKAVIDVRVIGGFYEITQTLTFYNKYDRRLEGMLEIPLPLKATVCGFAVETNGVLVHACAVEKHQARKVFENEVRKGGTDAVAIVEQTSGNIYRTRIWPLEPNGTKTVMLTYSQQLSLSGGQGSIQDPLASSSLTQSPLRRLGDHLLRRLLAFVPIDTLGSISACCAVFWSLICKGSLFLPVVITGCDELVMSATCAAQPLARLPCGTALNVCTRSNSSTLQRKVVRPQRRLLMAMAVPSLITGQPQVVSAKRLLKNPTQTGGTNEAFFCVLDVPVPMPALQPVEDQLHQTAPKTVCVLWDTSFSCGQTLAARHLRLQILLAVLEGYPASTTIALTTFGCKVRPWVVSAVPNTSQSRQKIVNACTNLVYDGATALNTALQFIKAQGTCDTCLLFSDGGNNLSASSVDVEDATRLCVHCFDCGGGDPVLLSAVASRSGGTYHTLADYAGRKTSPRLFAPIVEATVTSTPFGFLRAYLDIDDKRCAVRGSSGIVPCHPRAMALGDRLTVLGKFPAGGPETVGVVIEYGRLNCSAAGCAIRRCYTVYAPDPKPTLAVSTVTATTSPAASVHGAGGAAKPTHSVTGMFLGRLWAAAQASEMVPASDKHRQELVRLGSEYGIVTPVTTLLVLTTLKQHLQHSITPNRRAHPDMFKAYMATKKEAKQTEERRRAKKLVKIEGLWRARVNDHEKHEKVWTPPPEEQTPPPEVQQFASRELALFPPGGSLAGSAPSFRPRSFARSTRGHASQSELTFGGPQRPMYYSRRRRRARGVGLDSLQQTTSTPSNYVAGLGRGASGFTMRSDIGPARSSNAVPCDAVPDGIPTELRPSRPDPIPLGSFSRQSTLNQRKFKRRRFRSRSPPDLTPHEVPHEGIQREQDEHASDQAEVAGNYMDTIRAAGSSGGVAACYKAYLNARPEHGHTSAFFLDVASHLVSLKPMESSSGTEHGGPSALAVQVATAALELGAADVGLKRRVAYFLDVFQAWGLAQAIFEDVLRLRPDEPQSHRDLALVLFRKAQQQMAQLYSGVDGRDGSDTLVKRLSATAILLRRSVALLEMVVCMDVPVRFNEIEATALIELNNIRAHISHWLATMPNTKSSELAAILSESKLPKSLTAHNLDCRVRVVMARDTDNVDIDLHVVEPLGEEAYYNNNRTRIGGRMSRDFRGGFGPEEYLLRHAVSGTYTVFAKYFASHRRDTAGITTLLLCLYQDYGRPATQRRRMLTVRLPVAGGKLKVGTVVVPASDVKAQVERSCIVN